MTLYNLMITNHKDVNLYVYGTVHIEGTPADEPYYFAGTVPAHGTKCLLTTIDEDFNEVRIIKYQEDL